MNFNPEAVASWHGNSKTIPKRRFRGRVGLCRTLPGARWRRRPTAQPRLARGVRWTEVDRAHRLCLALYATRAASVGGHLSTNAAMPTRGGVRGDGPRFARTVAPFGGQSARSDGNHTGLPHPAIHPGERLSGRLRRGEAQEKGTKLHAAVDTLGHLLALHVRAA